MGQSSCRVLAARVEENYKFAVRQLGGFSPDAVFGQAPILGFSERVFSEIETLQADAGCHIGCRNNPFDAKSESLGLEPFNSGSVSLGFFCLFLGKGLVVGDVRFGSRLELSERNTKFF
jgi:hypothetical protein